MQEAAGSGLVGPNNINCFIIIQLVVEVFMLGLARASWRPMECM